MSNEQLKLPRTNEEIDAAMKGLLQGGQGYFTYNDILHAAGNTNQGIRYRDNLLGTEIKPSLFTTRTEITLRRIVVPGPKKTPLYLYYNSQRFPTDEAFLEVYSDKAKLGNSEEEQTDQMSRLTENEIAYLKRTDPILIDEVNVSGMNDILHLFSGRAALIRIKKNNSQEIIETPRLLALRYESEDISKAMDTEKSTTFVENSFSTSAINTKLYKRTQTAGIWYMTIDGKSIGRDTRNPFPSRLNEAIEVLSGMYSIESTKIRHIAEAVADLKQRPDIREKITSPVRKVYALFSHDGNNMELSEQEKYHLNEFFLFNPQLTFQDKHDLSQKHRIALAQTEENDQKYLQMVTNTLDHGTTETDLEKTLGLLQNSLRKTASDWQQTVNRTAEDILNLDATDAIFCLPILSTYLTLITARMEELTQKDQTVSVQKIREFHPTHKPTVFVKIEEWYHRYNKTNFEEYCKKLNLTETDLQTLAGSEVDKKLAALIFDEESMLRILFDDLITESYDLNREKFTDKTQDDMLSWNTLITEQFTYKELADLILYTPVDSTATTKEISALEVQIKKLSLPINQKSGKSRQQLAQAKSRLIELKKISNTHNPTKNREIVNRIREAIKQKTQRPNSTQFDGRTDSPEYQQALDLHLAHKSITDEAERQHRKQVIYRKG